MGRQKDNKKDSKDDSKKDETEEEWRKVDKKDDVKRHDKRDNREGRDGRDGRDSRDRDNRRGDGPKRDGYRKNEPRDEKRTRKGIEIIMRARAKEEMNTGMRG